MGAILVASSRAVGAALIGGARLIPGGRIPHDDGVESWTLRVVGVDTREVGVDEFHTGHRAFLQGVAQLRDAGFDNIEVCQRMFPFLVIPRWRGCQS